MSESVISIKDLSKSFGDHEVLRKIDINVNAGEIICIVGSSGSGKSTLLRCINKLEKQTSGKILYHNKEVRDVQKEINEYRSKVGMVFQSFNLFNNMTVLENCMLCTRKVLHLPKEEAFNRAVIDQVQDVMHTFNYPYTIPQALLAEKVCTTIGMDKIFFQNSGTEANEAMIKMARK